MMDHMRTIALVLMCLLGGMAPRAQAAEPTGPMVLHLPGIGGHLLVDDLLVEGLTQGRLGATFRIYDWTNGNPGIPALGGYERNRAESEKISATIVEMSRANPGRRFIITTHSGGAGLAVWALERLPEDVKIDTLVMIAPALSPKYDLSKALTRVSGRAYSFNSLLDPILGFGTRNLGTIDRVMTASAGNVGFTPPESADLKMYEKLVQIPYDEAWMRLGNAGDHIGAMNRPFARIIIAPLLLTGRLPRLVPISTTQPSTRAAGG